MVKSAILFMQTLLALSLCGHAARADVVVSVAAALRPFVKKLERPLHVYHYTSRGDLGLPKTGKLDVAKKPIFNYVREASEYFWDLGQPDGTGMIRGMYLASDPVASRDFGGDHWILFRVALPRDARYLDMIELEKSNRIPESLSAQLAESGCTETKWSYLIYKSFVPACREIATRALRELDLDYISYGWVSAGYPTCLSRPDDTVLLLRASALAKDSVRVFYLEIPHKEKDGLAEQRMLERFFLRARPNLASSGYTPPISDPLAYRLWPELDASAPSDAEFEAYLAANIFGCPNLQ